MEIWNGYKVYTVDAKDVEYIICDHVKKDDSSSSSSDSSDSDSSDDEKEEEKKPEPKKDVTNGQV